MRPPKRDTPPSRSPAVSALPLRTQGQVVPVTQVVSGTSVQVVDGRLVVVRLPLPAC